jgi:hypothetical protein
VSRERESFLKVLTPVVTRTRDRRPFSRSKTAKDQGFGNRRPALSRANGNSGQTDLDKTEKALPGSFSLPFSEQHANQPTGKKENTICLKN